MVTTNSSVQDLVVRVSELIRDTESKEVDVLRLTKETVVSAIRVLGPVVKYIEQEYTEMEPGFKFQTSVRGIYLGTYQLRHPEHDYVEDFPAFLVHGGNVRILSRENSLLASWISAQPDDCKESLGDFVESLSEDELSEVLETVHQSLLNAEAKLQDRLQKLQERERKIQTTRDMLNS